MYIGIPELKMSKAKILVNRFKQMIINLINNIQYIKPNNKN